MTQIRAFQALVIASTACYVAWFFLPYWSDYLTDTEQRMTEVSGYGALLPIQHPIYYSIWFGLWIVAALGLIFVQNWARHLYLALTLLTLSLTPFSGFIVQAPLDTLFSNANLLLDGAVLAVAYLSPLAASFDQATRNNRPRKNRRAG